MQLGRRFLVAQVLPNNEMDNKKKGVFDIFKASAETYLSLNILLGHLSPPALFHV